MPEFDEIFNFDKEAECYKGQYQYFDEVNKIKIIVATLTLKRLSDNEIIKEIEKQTGKIISR